VRRLAGDFSEASMVISCRWAAGSALAAGLLVLGLGMQGCVATTVAGATLGVAGAAVKTAAVTGKATVKVVGGAARVTAHVARHAAKKSGQAKPAAS
jgi:hypothetical protein